MEDCNNAYRAKYVTDVPLGRQTDGHTWEGGGLSACPMPDPAMGT